MFLQYLITGVLSLSAVIGATDKLQNDSAHISGISELSEMVVSGYHSDNISSSTKTFLAEDFTGKYQDLAALLGTVSGVTVYRTGGFGAYSSIQVRGSAANQVQIFLDGIPLNNAGGGAVDIGKIPLGSLQEIKIHKSSAPLQLIGSNAGAVIELRSKPGENTDITNASGEMGSFGYRKAGTLISRGINGIDHWFSVDFSHSNNDFPYDWDPTAYRSGDEVEKRMDNEYFTGAFGQYGFSCALPGNRLKLTSHLSLSHTENGIFWTATADSNDGFFRNNSVDGLLKCQLSPGKNTDLIFELSGRQQKRLMQRKAPFSTDNARKRQSLLPFGELSAMLMHTFTDHWNMKAFVASEYNSFCEEDLWNQGRASPYSRRIAARAGLEASWDYSQKFIGNVKAMMRFESDSTNGVNYSYVHHSEPVKTFDNFPHAEIFLNYSIIPQLSIFTTCNYRFRSPGFSEKFASNENIRGNAKLLPEKRLEYDAGIMLKTAKLRLTLTGYANRISDKISYIGRSQGIFIPTNFSNVHGYGLESECNLSIFSWISVANIFTLMKNTIYSDLFPSWNGKNEPNLPRIQDYCAVDLKIRKLNFRHQCTLSSGYFTDSDNISTDFFRPVPELGLSISLQSLGPVSITYRLDNYLQKKVYQSESEGMSVHHTQIYHGTPKPGRMHVVSLQLKM